MYIHLTYTTRSIIFLVAVLVFYLISLLVSFLIYIHTYIYYIYIYIIHVCSNVIDINRSEKMKKKKKETKKIRSVCRDSIRIRSIPMRQHRGIVLDLTRVCVCETIERRVNTGTRKGERYTCEMPRQRHEGPPHFTAISLTRSNVFLTRDKRKSIKHT